ncbi:hypothetical protein ACFSM5_03100 [Lacibacterium aquatile]|uniref:Poly(3-hydroxyalkanoate) polymerase subunit PhaE n=1 Tax=Lacibacterium aquatile TaxID=1168082 RepID=A0ABW5DLR5_9PROT
MADGKDPKDAPPPDLAVLAEQFLDLWQGQLTAWASDPDLAERTARMWGAWAMPLRAGTMPGTGAGAMPDAAHAATPTAAEFAQHEPQQKQDRAEAAAAPFGELLGELRQLSTRLGALEQRLADLERAERERAGRRPESSPRSRRRRP